MWSESDYGFKLFSPLALIGYFYFSVLCSLWHGAGEDLVASMSSQSGLDYVVGYVRPASFSHIIIFVCYFPQGSLDLYYGRYLFIVFFQKERKSNTSIY